ncbi:unnamed protein product [Didymodactylos carnosus]|uniref:N-acetylmuramoyl-L-alanine amidase n=1 Tax=Didymodactylos carnosus TaxID=1234261 RepID=A0A814WA99_9BILA|nr:unnamed protein product [Didymodactylos carnosus]CAF1195952.1 unnamed protein product [Didymodactylos carnosus]CAF3785543.1 unnamed protein product [Didymodactylos carnosus]CAF3960306.1 unnamed protein product [Didymodactylos carnosus]
MASYLIAFLLCVLVSNVVPWTLDYPSAQQVSSPHFNRGRSGHAIKAIVLHGTAGGGTVQWFLNPASKVSAHYVVEQDGRVVQMVSEDDTAWHAGVVTTNSQFYGQPNPNLWAIGIEFSRNINNDNDMPEVQIQAGLRLVSDILRRYGKLPRYTHDQISVGRICPGPKFPTSRFLAL